MRRTSDLVMVSVLCMPSGERRGGAGVRASELVGEQLQPLERGGVVVELPGSGQPALDGRSVTLGQVIDA
jgi:hypothetical protein